MNNPLVFESWQAHARYYLLVGIVLVSAACATPRITSINPTYGPQGTEVTVTGEWLVGRGQSANTAAYLGALPQPVQSTTSTTVKFRVAPGAVTNPVRITTPSGAAISPRGIRGRGRRGGSSGTVYFWRHRPCPGG